MPPAVAVDQAIHEDDEKYRKLFETLTDAFLIFDVDAELFVEANHAAQKLYGYTREEFLKLHHLDITAEREESAVTLQRIIKGEIGQVPLRYHKRKDGTTFPADIMTSTITVGGHTLVYGIIKDITERMQAQEALTKANELLEQRVAERTAELQVSEARNRFLSEGTFEGILVHDKGKIIDCNNSFAKMLGYEPHELIGLNGVDFIAPEWRETVRRHIQTERTEPYEAIGLRKDGSTFPIEIHAKMLDYDGQTVRFASCRDITERKQAQDSLRKTNEELELRIFERTQRLAEVNKMLQASDERYRQLVNNTETGFVVISDEGIVIEANDPYLRQVGMDNRDGVIGHSVIEWTAPEEKENNAAAIALCTKQGYIRDFETVYLRKNGERVYLLINATMYQTLGRKQFVSLCRNITERKQAENELAARERTLRTLVNSVPYNTMLLDRDGIIHTINDAMCKRIGKRREDLIGTDIRNHVAPEVFKRRRSWTQHVITSGKPIHSEDEINGRLFSHSQFPVFGRDGTATGVVAFEEDITDRKKAQDELAARERTMHTLLDSFPHYTALIDKDGIFLALNDAWSKGFGKRREELVGTNFRLLLPPELAQGRWEMLQKVIVSGKPLSFEDQNGGLTLSNAIFPVFGSQGEVTAVTVFVEDITQKRKHEEEIGMYREKMARAEQLATVGTLSAMVAHQLNQPLTVMRLLLQDAQESLKSGKLKKTIAERIANVLIEVDKTAEISKNLLHWSLPSMVNHRRPLSLVRIAEHIVKFFTSTARHAGVELVVDARLGDIGELVGNPTDFEQIFFIMIENAIQAAGGKKKCHLHIGGGLENGQVLLTFTDTCGGIEPEHVERLFEPFFTTKSPDGGTGLGLAIVKRIVEHYGGTVSVESRHGHGTVFSIKMPLAMLK